MKNSALNLETVRALKRLRKQIDAADRQLLKILSQRLEMVTAIGLIKLANNMPLLQKARWQELVTDRVKAGKKLGLNARFVMGILNVVHLEAIRIQKLQKRTKSRKK